MFNTPHDTIDLDHSRLAYWRLGQGPDLMLIHGWPLHSATYRNLLPLLSQHFTCHLIDLPGAGMTVVHDERAISMRRHVDTVLAAIDALQLEHYAMLSHDSGAFITRNVAAKRPGQVSALVMGNTEMPRYVSPMLKLLASVCGTRAGRAAMSLALRSRTLRKSSLFYGSCFDDASFCEGEFEQHFITPFLASPERAAQQMRLLVDFDWTLITGLADVHAAIEAPVQLIWGADDPWFPLKHAQQMQHDFRGGCELEVIRPGKLFAHEEFPERFASLAIAFIERAHETQTRAA